jgi:hypothetical protein
MAGWYHPQYHLHGALIMKKLLLAALLFASSLAGAASITVDMNYLGSSMANAYAKVTNVSGGDTGWSCTVSVWPTQLLSLTNSPTQTFSVPGPVPYTQGSDPLDACLNAAKAITYFSNIR